MARPSARMRRRERQFVAKFERAVFSPGNSSEPASERVRRLSEMGARLKSERLRLGLTTTQLAQNAGVSGDLIEKIEAGRADMNDTVERAFYNCFINIDFVRGGVSS
ncbi:MAG: helix-turn-helix transcriptional regulator [Alphaproteobacteria bacterium]|nr:helix-turn-helix transcriptional regulator [Alphaproteobacteria bacterium]